MLFIAYSSSSVLSRTFIVITDGNVFCIAETYDAASSSLPAMNAEASFRGTGENTMPSISVMKALNSFIPPSPSTIRAEADDKAFAQLLGDENTARDGWNTTMHGAWSSALFLASLGLLTSMHSPIGEKNEGAAKCILSSSPSFFLNENILLGKLCVAFLADLDLVSVNFLLVKALDSCSLANRACCSAVVYLIADTRSSMCFGHTLLL